MKEKKKSDKNGKRDQSRSNGEVRLWVHTFTNNCVSTKAKSTKEGHDSRGVTAQRWGYCLPQTSDLKWRCSFKEDPEEQSNSWLTEPLHEYHDAQLNYCNNSGFGSFCYVLFAFIVWQWIHWTAVFSPVNPLPRPISIKKNTIQDKKLFANQKQPAWLL